MAGPEPSNRDNIEIRSCFATPVVFCQVAGAEALNKALKTTILERERTGPSADHSNLGGWQSSDDFAEWGGDAGRAILHQAVVLADQLTADNSGQPVKVKWRMNSWANINRAGHANESHTHPGCYWSGCYYVDDGGTAEDASLGGEFEIRDPRGAAPVMYAPKLSFALPGCQSMGASELIRPHAGLMLFIPSWLAHSVRPYLGEGTRISIAFNLSV